MTARHTPFDVWCVARVLAGRPVAAHLDRASPGLREHLRELEELPVADRPQEALARFSTGLLELAAKADPDGVEPDDGLGRVVLTCMADVEPRPVQFLWPKRVPRGKVSILSGDPGLGKSFVSISISAIVSTGGGWPDDPDYRAEPGDVVLLSAEDDPADTIRPRLDAHGADVRRVHVLETVRRPDGSHAPFNLQEDLPRLEAALRRLPNPRLVVIDPVSAYLGETDDCKNGAIRGLMAPLGALAARHDVAVMIVSHLNKSGGGGNKAIYRSMGSLAFVAAARMAYLVAKDKEEPARRLVLPVKNNVSAEMTGLAYRIVDGRIAWEAEPVTIDADEALSQESRGANKNAIDSDNATLWLRSFLAGGPRPAEECASQGNIALDLKHSLKWWRDAVLKSRIGGHSRKAGFGQGWVWVLPDADGGPGEDETPRPFAELTPSWYERPTLAAQEEGVALLFDLDGPTASGGRDE